MTFFIIVKVVSNAKQNIIKELQVFKSGKEIRWILIMLTNSWLKQKIKNRNILITILLRFYFVESPRIELGSKQAINRLSTRLVFSWFSIICWLKTLYILLIFFSFKTVSKRYNFYVNIYDASKRTPLTKAFKRHLALLPSRTRLDLTIFQIKQLKRSYSRRLKFDIAFYALSMSLRDMLTIQ